MHAKFNYIVLILVSTDINILFSLQGSALWTTGALLPQGQGIHLILSAAREELKLQTNPRKAARPLPTPAITWTTSSPPQRTGVATAATKQSWGSNLKKTTTWSRTALCVVQHHECLCSERMMPVWEAKTRQTWEVLYLITAYSPRTGPTHLVPTGLCWPLPPWNLVLLNLSGPPLPSVSRPYRKVFSRRKSSFFPEDTT